MVESADISWHFCVHYLLMLLYGIQINSLTNVLSNLLIWTLLFAGDKNLTQNWLNHLMYMPLSLKIKIIIFKILSPPWKNNVTENIFFPQLCTVTKFFMTKFYFLTKFKINLYIKWLSRNGNLFTHVIKNCEG